MFSDWVKENGNVFQIPITSEFDLVNKIFKIPHFQGLIRKQEYLQGKPVADPFVIAKAGCVNNGCVVTTEKFKTNASKIPNICKEFHIPYMNLEEFMEEGKGVF